MTVRETEKYKLRVYVISGPNKGNLDHEEFFDSINELNKRYEELFDYNLYAYNPTAWEWDGNDYKRISGY